MEAQNERIISTNRFWMSEEVQQQVRLHQQVQETLAPLPEGIWQDVESADRVLAISSGVWAVDHAKRHPSTRVFCIECTANGMEAACLYARQERLENTIFQQQEVSALASIFSEAELFSFIRCTFIAESLLHTSYPTLARCLYQLCRPGGLLTWTECEFPETSSLAFQTLIALICKGLDAIGHRYEPPSELERRLLALGWNVEFERRRLDITIYLGSRLRRAGFYGVRLVPHAIDVSAYAPAHALFIKQVELGLKRVQSFLLECGVIGMSEFNQLVAEALCDMERDDFCGLICSLTVYGYKL